MHPITSEQLSAIIARLDARSDEDGDELLTDLLVAAYPSRLTQDN